MSCILESAQRIEQVARQLPNRRRRFGFALIAMAISCVAAVATAEMAIRLLVPKTYWIFHDSKQDWQSDSKAGWSQRANFRVVTMREDGTELVFETNADGLRPQTAQRAPMTGRPRLLLFGDSTAVGRSVPYEKSLTACLERSFANRGFAVEAINAGVEGYATDQELVHLQKTVPQYSPDVVLLCVCSNDHGGNTRAREYGLNKVRFSIDSADNLIEVPCLPNADIGWFGNGPRHWLQFSAAYRLVQPALVRIRGRLGGDDLDARLGFAPWYYVRSRPDLGQLDWRLFSALLRQMNTCCRKAGAEFCFFGHPALEEVWDPYIQCLCTQYDIPRSDYDPFALENRYRAIGRQHNLAVIPLVAEFRNRQNEGPFHLLPRDPHCNERGYETTAELLVDKLMASSTMRTRLTKSSMSSSSRENAR